MRILYTSYEYSRIEMQGGGDSGNVTNDFEGAQYLHCLIQNLAFTGKPFLALKRC